MPKETRHELAPWQENEETHIDIGFQCLYYLRIQPISY